MFCEQCGSTIADDSTACPACGAARRVLAAAPGDSGVAVSRARVSVADWTTSMGVCDWVAAGSALFLFIGLFLPWVMARNQGVTIMSGADYGWLAIISVIAVFAVMALRLFRVHVGLPSSLIYIYFGVFATLITGIAMAIRPVTTKDGAYFTGAITRYPFVGAGIALVASLAILISGIVQRDGAGLPEEDGFEQDFPGMRAADFVAGTSALLLFVALFMPWVSSTSQGYTWVSGAGFGWVAIIGVLLVVGALVVEFLPFDLPVPTYVLYALGGGIALLMIVLMMAIRPMPVGNEEGFLRIGLFATLNAAYSSSGPSIAPYFGAYMGLAATLGILLGGYMKWQEQ